MMEKINVLYIDDDIDPIISKCLAKYMSGDRKALDIDYKEIQFEDSLGYEDLIRDERVYTANVILIDSQLFKNKTALSGKYTGEEFRLVLKKMLPYIQVIVITQNPLNQDFPSTISKYNSEMKETADEYYKEKLIKLLDLAIMKVCEYRKVESIINDEMDNKYWVEKIRDSLEGISIYDELSKSDIDRLVEEFKKIQEAIND